MTTREAGVTCVFGGSFNPPHLSHVLAASVVLARFDVARVLFVPTYQHPFAKELASYEDRVRMCELATAWLPRTHVSRVEQELGGESRTLWTLEHLARVEPSWNLRLLIGADILNESSKWFAFDKITALAPPIVLGRVGVVAEGAPKAVLPDISSTHVRALARREAWGELEELLPRDVLAYVRERGLYRT